MTTTRDAQRSTLGLRRLFLPSFSRPLGGCEKAFTLIETALAMLAIGLGLLAIFGLGRLGLQSNKESLNTQRCDMFANAIFETLREYNTRFVNEARTNTLGSSWVSYWTATTNHTVEIPFPPVATMSDNADLRLRFNATMPTYTSDTIHLSEWNPLYMLTLAIIDGSYVAQDFNLIRATLFIFPDGLTDSSEARTYTTTLSNSGGLP